MEATLQRRKGSLEGTPGIMTIEGPDNVHAFCTLELPWKENKTGVSCIPAGTYKVKLGFSPSRGKALRVEPVEGRTGILIHSGNLAGSTADGFLTHVQGCILVGRYFGRIGKQRAVLASKPAMTDLLALVGEDEFTLTIKEEA